MSGGPERELARQQALLGALTAPAGEAGAARLAGWAAPTGLARGLAAYRANAWAIAERALAAASPTVAAVLGTEALAALARSLWRAHPPQRGDLAEWGSELPDLIDADPLDGAPWLADLARLDAAVHRAERAADAPWPVDPAALGPLADTDPAAIQLHLRPGTAVVVSSWPVVTLRAAFTASASASAAADNADDGLAPAHAALAEGRGETALVWRDGWRVAVAAVDAAEAAFTGRVLVGDTLGSALEGAGEGFDFERWLIAQVQRGIVCGAGRVAAGATMRSDRCNDPAAPGD